MILIKINDQVVGRMTGRESYDIVCPITDDEALNDLYYMGRRVFMNFNTNNETKRFLIVKENYSIEFSKIGF